MSAEISDQIRRLIFKKHLKNIFNAEISRDFVISATIASRIIKRYLETLDFSTQSRGGDRRTVLTENHRAFLKNMIDEDCQKTLQYLTDTLNKRFNMTVSFKTVKRAIDNFNFSLKIIILLSVRPNTIENIEMRHKYTQSFYRLVAEYDGENFIFFDELGFKVGMGRSRGRSERGFSANISVPKLRSRNISCCAIMRKESLFGYRVRKSV
ncbi:hypothetical protein M153_11580002516 [Pseudoloma neurophilia]|uniref:Transposase n=1 Tax=Pseudoloma neurophilia TaxID=146866 RepID=A0A0R0M1K8_9MICR|nr:hypothetical protein M153_11580002516 [Pseudoloma neurophilia]